MPSLKKQKKRLVWRRRKISGSYRFEKRPIRYPIYDILEYLENKIPCYTIVSEPEEPMRPVLDVPLTMRYPWAGALEKIHPWKIKNEDESPMERLHGNIRTELPPPTTRVQKMIARRGFPTQKYPRWMEPSSPAKALPPDFPWRKDRRIDKIKEEIGLTKKKKVKGALASGGGGSVTPRTSIVDFVDSMDSALSQMESSSE